MVHTEPGKMIIVSEPFHQLRPSMPSSVVFRFRSCHSLFLSLSPSLLLTRSTTRRNNSATSDHVGRQNEVSLVSDIVRSAFARKCAKRRVRAKGFNRIKNFPNAYEWVNMIKLDLGIVPNPYPLLFLALYSTSELCKWSLAQVYYPNSWPHPIGRWTIFSVLFI